MSQREISKVDEEIDLSEIVRALWAGWKFICIAILASLTLAALYLHLATFKYRIEYVLTPVQSGEAGGIPSGVSGLASLAGIGLPADSSQSVLKLYLEGVHSRVVADELATKNALLIKLFPTDWSTEREDWIAPTSLPKSVIKAIKLVLGFPPENWSKPDGSRVQHYLKEEVNVDYSETTGIIKLSTEHKDPRIAMSLLGDLHSIVDDVLRARMLVRAEKNIDYINNRLQQISVSDYRETLLEALAREEKKRMTASPGLPFAAEPFGVPVSSENPTTPNPAFIIIAAICFGSFVGILIALWKCYRRAEA